MRHRSAFTHDQGNTQLSEEPMFGVAQEAARAGMTIDQYLAQRLNSQAQSQQANTQQDSMRNEILTALNAMQRMVNTTHGQPQQQAPQQSYIPQQQYAPQQSFAPATQQSYAPPSDNNYQMEEMGRMIHSLKNEINALNQNMHEQSRGNAAPSAVIMPFPDKRRMGYSAANPYELDMTLQEIEARQNEISQGIKKPQARAAYAPPPPMNSFTQPHTASYQQMNEERLNTKMALDELKRDIMAFSSALNDVAPKLQITNLHHSLKDLSRQMQQAEHYNPTPHEVQNYDGQLEAILKQLQHLKPMSNLAGLESEIQNLTQKLDVLSQREAPTKEIIALHQQIAALQNDVSQSPLIDLIKNISQEVNTLSKQSDKLWAMANAKPSHYSDLESKLDLLNQQMAQQSNSSNYNQSFQQEMNDLKSMVYNAISTPDTSQNVNTVAILENKIDQLAKLLEFSVKQGKQPQSVVQGLDAQQTDKINALERMLTSVVMKLDSMNAAPKTQNSTGELEQMLMTLAKKVDQTDQRLEKFGSLERNISSLLASLGGQNQQQPQEPSHQTYQQPYEPEQPITPPVHRAIDRLMDKIQPNSAPYVQQMAQEQRSGSIIRSTAPVASPQVAPPSFAKPIDTGSVPADLPLDIGMGSPLSKGYNPSNLHINDDMPQAKVGYVQAARTMARSAKEQAESSGITGLALKDKLLANKKALLIGLLAIVISLAGIQVATKMFSSPKPQVMSHSTKSDGKEQDSLSKLDSFTQQESPTKTVAVKDAPLFDPTVTGSTQATKALPKAGVVINDGWQPIAPTEAEKTAASSLAKASISLKAAAEKGNTSAQFEYANRLMDGAGIPRNQAEGVKFYKLAADNHFTPAQYILGSLYEKGIGTPRNLDEAKKYYLAAATKGHAKAMHNLAVMSADNREGKGDARAAAHWFRKAAEHGVVDSQFNLAVLYARGQGVEKSFVESYKWFALAAKGGDQDAASKREDIAKNLSDENLSAVKMAVDTFKPKQEPLEANKVDVPAGGWDSAATVAKTR